MTGARSSQTFSCSSRCRPPQERGGSRYAATFKSDFGNFSDGFRKVFYHEKISYNRRKDKEFVELEKPRLSALLSGTPSQIFSLIPDEGMTNPASLSFSAKIKLLPKNAFV